MKPLCDFCRERTARKNRKRCSRCDGAGHRREDIIVHGRPDRLVFTGLKIHDEKKILVHPDGRTSAIPKDLLRVHYLSSAPGDSRWLLVWKVQANEALTRRSNVRRKQTARPAGGSSPSSRRRHHA